jgi:hypothetical protein
MYWQMFRDQEVGDLKKYLMIASTVHITPKRQASPPETYAVPLIIFRQTLGYRIRISPSLFVFGCNNMYDFH